MSDDNKIIPINRGLIESMRRLLSALKELPWDGPSEFNAIFIDRKDFMKMMKVKNPPPPTFKFSVMPKLSIHFAEVDDFEPAFKQVQFSFYRKIGDTLEYREI